MIAGLGAASPQHASPAPDEVPGRFSPEAAEDLQRLFDHVLERELNSPRPAIWRWPSVRSRPIKNGVELLALTPSRAARWAAARSCAELVIPFGASGYVALFEIVGNDRVIVGAVRHQREDDYH